MLKNLFDEDNLIFRKNASSIESDFEKLKDSLQSSVEDKLAAVEGFSGIWSVDFMWDGEKFWLIDMAIGYESYYFDKIKR